MTFTWNLLLKLQRAILIGTSILIVLLLMVTIIARYILETDVKGIEELLLLPIFWLYFIGASYASYEDSHISGDIVGAYVKNKLVLNGIRIVALLITLGSALVFLVWSFQYFFWNLNSGSSTPLWNIPLYLAYLSVVIGFVLMSLYTVVRLINNVKSMVGK